MGLKYRPRRRRSRELEIENKTKPKGWRKRKQNERKKKRRAKQKKNTGRKKKLGARRKRKRKNVARRKQHAWRKKVNNRVVLKKTIDQDLHERWTMLQTVEDISLLGAEDKVAWVILVAVALEEVAILVAVVMKVAPEAIAEVAT